MSQPAGLADQVVVVTGASSGVGRATTEALVAEGAHVVAVGRDPDRLAAVAATDGPGRVSTVAADLADPASAEAIVAASVEVGGRLDAVVHAAGIFDPRPLEDSDLASLQAQLAVNTIAPYLLTRAALPHLGRGSRVVFVTSTVAHRGFPFCSAYTASKGALRSASAALAKELAPRGIRVNEVAPGFVRTSMLEPVLAATPGYEDFILERTPTGFIAEADDLAHDILFLLSPRSRNVLGTTLVSDGGWIG